MKKSASSLMQHAPRFAQRAQSHIASLCSGLLLRDFVPRRPSKVCAIAACSSQPSSCSAQHASRFAHWAKSRLNSLCLGAFTMAEAIIVMTILGIIATIMITNLKPAEYRDKGLEVLAKKNIEQVDQVIHQILNNHSQDGTLEKLYKLNTTTTFSLFSDTTSADELFKKYLVTKRGGLDVDGNGVINTGDARRVTLLNNNRFVAQAIQLRTISRGLAYVLKDDSILFLGDELDDKETFFPGETTSCVTSSAFGFVMLDVNGWKEEPNLLGKDIFVLPLDKYGIAYDMPCD